MSYCSEIINKVLLLLLIAFSLSYSQTSNLAETNKNKQSEKRLPVTPMLENRLPFAFNTFGLSNIDYSALRPSSYYLTPTNNFNQIKQNIRLGFSVIQKANERKSLGVFGKILGYTNFAATAGLAAYHIYKYGWNGEKLKKKK